MYFDQFKNVNIYIYIYIFARKRICLLPLKCSSKASNIPKSFFNAKRDQTLRLDLLDILIRIYTSDVVRQKTHSSSAGQVQETWKTYICIFCRFSILWWRESYAYITQSLSWLLLAWWHLEPEHQESSLQWRQNRRQIASLTIVYLTVYSGADQRRHQTPRHCPLIGVFTGDRWTPRTNGQ